MTICDLCGSGKNVEKKIFPTQRIINAHVNQEDKKNSNTVTIWRGDACKQCFDELTRRLKAAADYLIGGMKDRVKQ